MKYRAKELGYVEDFRGLGLTSRKNLCLHPSVKKEKSGAIVDARCRSLTAGFVKEKKDRGEDVPVCIYHDVGLLYAFGRSLLTSSRIWIKRNRMISFQMGSTLLPISSSMARNISSARTLPRDGWCVITAMLCISPS
jgi:hypothetical protein